ncbi:MAG: T9SS type A sorting domain-containing protein [Saprospiraceae bacterium]
MKKILFAFCFLLSLSQAKSQYVIYPVVSEDNKFVISHLNFLLKHDILVFSFSSDSIFLDDGYYRRLQYHYFDDPDTIYPLGYCYRQEGNKVYQNYKTTNTIIHPGTILYDFDLEVGDTLWREINIYQGHQTVTKIDTIAMEDGSLRKYYTIHCDTENFDNHWIEGMGDIELMLWGGNCSIQDGEYFSMLCYHNNDELVYINPQYSSCFQLATKSPDGNYSKIFPNPVSDFLTIESSIAIDNVLISNISGQIVNAEYHEGKLNTAPLQDGMYILAIRYKSGATEYLKFLKAE